MNTSKTKKGILLMLVACFAVSSALVAGTSADNKTTEKARETVANASPDDWSAYMKSAEKCIRKGVNLEEAEKWIDYSISISKNEHNLEVKGDLYMKNNDPQRAGEYYLEAMKIIKARDVNGNISALQEKMAKVKEHIF